MTAPLTPTSNITLNQVPQSPTLTDLLNLFKKEIMLELNSHHIGIVQAFDPVLQTVQATVKYTRTSFVFNDATEQDEPVQTDYPLSLECPAIILRGGPTSLTFPILPGDECLLIFNDRDMDNWFASGQYGPVATSRLHSFADAFALVGIRSTPNALTSYDQLRAVLQNGTTMVGVGPALIKIANATTTLGTILGNLKTALSTLATSLGTVATALGGNPGTETAAAAAGVDLATSATALTTSLTAIQLLITELLE